MSDIKTTILFIAFAIGLFVLIFISRALTMAYVGTALLGWMGYAIFGVYRIKRNGHLVTGYIVNVEIDSDGDPTPVVEFLTLEGEKVTGNPVISFSLSVSGINVTTINPKPIQLIYRKSKPSQFYLSPLSGMDIIGLGIFIAAGLFFFVFGLGDYFIWHNIK